MGWGNSRLVNFPVIKVLSQLSVAIALSVIGITAGTQTNNHSLNKGTMEYA